MTFNINNSARNTSLNNKNKVKNVKEGFKNKGYLMSKIEKLTNNLQYGLNENKDILDKYKKEKFTDTNNQLNKDNNDNEDDYEDENDNDDNKILNNELENESDIDSIQERILENERENKSVEYQKIWHDCSDEVFNFLTSIRKGIYYTTKNALSDIRKLERDDQTTNDINKYYFSINRKLDYFEHGFQIILQRIIEKIWRACS